MVSVTQQILQAQRKQRNIQQAQERQQLQQPIQPTKEYDMSTTEGQVLGTRQQLQQARIPLQQFKETYLYPKQRRQAFTPRRERAQILQAGQGVAEQLGQIQQQEQTFEREVATKAPEYALQNQKQQALIEAKQSIQSRIDDLQARIQKRLEYIERKRQDRSDKSRRESINNAEDDIEEYQAELREYQKALGLSETDLIKQHFSGYIKDKANYEADYQKARNQQQADFRKMKQDPKFQDTLKQLNLPSNASLSQFNQAVKKYNSDVAYKNQLLKFAEQKGGVQFLNPEQQKALGVDTQGFTYYKTPQKGWFDPRTGQVVEMSFINDQIPKNLGYLPVEIQGFNKQTGKYITDSPSSLMTPQQQRMYEAFQKSPRTAELFGYKIDQSAMLPTSFILGGTSQGVPIPQKVNVFEQISTLKQPTSAYDVAIRMQPFTAKELKSMDELKRYNELGISPVPGDPLFDVAIGKSNILDNSSSIAMAAIPKDQRGIWQIIKESFSPKEYYEKYTKPALEIYNHPNLTDAEKSRKLFSLGKKQQEEIINSKEFKVRLGSFLTIASLGAGLGISTTAAITLNTGNFAKLLNPVEKNETKVAAVKDIAIALGTAYVGGLAFGAVAGAAKDAAQVAGYRILASVLRNAGTKGSAIARNIAALSLQGAGKATQFGIETYFKKQMFETGIMMAQSLRQRDYGKASISTAEFIGGYGIPGTRIKGGFQTGMKLGSKAVSLTGFLTGSLVSSRPELYKGRVTIKRAPSAIQADILTGKGNVIAYRRGPLQTGLKYEPRIDKYLTKRIKTPTKGTFFRYEETIGVKGKRIQPSLSTPAFVQPPSYREMFMANLKSAKGSKFNKLMAAFAKTPVMTDVLGVMKVKTKIDPKLEQLRQQAIKEFATTGKLSTSTKKAILKADTKISDKVRELEFAEEQELVLRNLAKLKGNVKFGFTRDASGKIIPVLYEAGTLKPKTSVLLKKKIITEQDAKFIQRQYNMWQKFGEKYVLPKEHSVRHSKEVARNIRKLVDSYPEYHYYLKKKYGSLDKAVKALEAAAKFHDIGKTSETSAEFGTPHGQKFYDVYKAKLLPKEAQNLPESIARAIKTHETLAGTNKGRFTLRYQLSNLLGGISPEQKLLSTADRLDLMRYGIDVNSGRLPLADALSRLGFKIKAPKKEPSMKKFISFVSGIIPARQVKATTQKDVYNYGLNLVSTTPFKYKKPQVAKQQYAYQSLIPSRSYATYKKPSTRYSAPYNKIDYFFRSFPYKASYKAQPKYSKPSYKRPDYQQPKYPRPTSYRPPYQPPRPKPTQPIMRTLIVRPRPSERRSQQPRQVRLPQRYNILPTITQQIYRVRRKGGKLKRATGFEIARI